MAFDRMEISETSGSQALSLVPLEGPRCQQQISSHSERAVSFGRGFSSWVLPSDRRTFPASTARSWTISWISAVDSRPFSASATGFLAIVSCHGPWKTRWMMSLTSSPNRATFGVTQKTLIMKPTLRLSAGTRPTSVATIKIDSWYLSFCWFHW